MSKRHVWARTAAVAVLGLSLTAPLAAFADEFIEGTFPPIKAGKPYAGTTLTIPTQKGWASFAPAVELTKNFEDMTGIKVQYDMIPGGDILSKQLLAVSQGSGTYDVVTQHAATFGSFFRFLNPIDDRINEIWGGVDKFE
ncbi:MAG: extracellular solute-binding protein, partial [Rhizobiaceae bacterium]|nr:extracellular solute-binding protein [Rhizobiaceae bacterium]